MFMGKLLLVIFILHFNLHASPEIVNGVGTNKYPGVVLVGLPSDLVKARCTAIAIGVGLFLTAAHCVYPSRTTTIAIQRKDVSNVIVAIHNGYLKYEAKHDIAILKISKEQFYSLLSDDDVIPISKKRAMKQDKVVLVGFGHNNCLKDSEYGFGHKRIGWNSVFDIEYSVISIKGKAKNSNKDHSNKAIACGGDSGGPMLSMNGELLGVASHGVYRWPFFKRTRITQYADVHEPSNKEFINKWLESI